MRRFAACLATMAALGFFALASPRVIAGEVVVSISGEFGAFSYGNIPAPLDDGYFSGTVTFASLPGANSTVISSTADVNFYNSSHTLLFTVGNGGYDTLTAGAHGYTYLSVGGIVDLGNGTSVDVAALGLEFKHWHFGSPFGIVKSYGPPTYESQVEYTYFPTGTNPNSDGTTYYDPVVRGFAHATSVPEPASIVLGIVGFAGALVYSRSYRRKATA
jgi:hypothetical protein